MKQDHMDLYISAVRSAYRIRRVCLNNRNSAKKMYDTVLGDEDRWDFYRGFEDIVEAANEVGSNGRFFMCLIRTLEILYIQDYYRPNAQGLDAFYFKHPDFKMPLDVLNLTNALINKDPEYNRQIEAEILVIVLMA